MKATRGRLIRPFASRVFLIYISMSSFTHPLLLTGRHLLHSFHYIYLLMELMASPGSDGSAAAAVCCMCGDHGLPRQLFRCKLCCLRLQHRYCSDLYPRVTAYRRCNWCLREEGGGGSPVKPTAAAKRRMSTTSSEMNNSEEDGENSRRSCGECSRSAFSAEPGKPVKKPKGDDERAVPPVPEVSATKGRRKLQAAAGKARFRVKVRRYKLLAEVISC